MSEPKCGCRKCLDDSGVRVQFGAKLSLPIARTRMILCATCGCKRCPHATDHNLACTGSNEPGQAGSIYA